MNATPWRVLTIRFCPLKCLAALAVLAGLAAPMARAVTGDSIVTTPHNLSVSGPGTIKATTEQEVCVFCHTPHNATSVQPLWNRSLPSVGYKPYTSTSLKSNPGQPTGSSKLCLSCHDGTIALGSVNSRGQQIAMAGGVTNLPPGSRTNLGTDLSDDHPISFPYNAALVSANSELKDPGLLPPAVPLDANKELQCTTCHDAHKNTYGNFLVMSNDNSELCNTCHTPSAGGTTDIQDHQNCNGCHQTHSAPSGPFLLAADTVTDTCLLCHGNTAPPISVMPAAAKAQLAATSPSAAAAIAARYRRVQGVNIAADLSKASSHDTNPKPSETASATGSGAHAGMTRAASTAHVTCSDCHEPHSMRSQSVAAAAHPGARPAPLGGTFGKALGLTIQGGKFVRATLDYEVCLKCHADNNTTRPYVSRVITQMNLRLDFAPGAVSFHPIAAPGKNMNVPSLKTPYTTTSLIGCVDCHASDTSKKAGGSGPNGPHGSNIPPLLLARYEMADFTNESPTAYALCYGCHERTVILSDRSTILHKQHVVDQRTPCSACHASHGIPQTQGTVQHNFGLVNFDTSIVLPDPRTKKLEMDHSAPGHGSCTLKCHGKVHSATPY